MRTAYQKTSMRFRFFLAKKTRKVMGFSGSVKGTTLVFANVNGPNEVIFLMQYYGTTKKKRPGYLVGN